MSLLGGWHTLWLSLLVLEARSVVDLRVWVDCWRTGGLPDGSLVSGILSVAAPLSTIKLGFFCTWMGTLGQTDPSIPTQLVPNSFPWPSSGGSVTMATRLGRKWLRRPTLTNQVTLQTSARDTRAQARALSNQDAVPLSPTTDSALEQWPMRLH